MPNVVILNEASAASFAQDDNFGHSISNARKEKS